MNEFDKQNKIAWGKAIKKNQMLYPNEKIVAFLARNYSQLEENSTKRALDIGFGSGRHLKLLMDYQFNAYGIDYSKESMEECQRILGENPLLKDLKLESIEDNDFEAEYFDAVIMYGVAFLRQYEEMLSDLQNICKVLKKGGKMIINFRTKEDGLFGKGEKIGGNSYLLDDSYPDYKGMLYTFLSQDEAENLLTEAGFIVENIEREDYWKTNLSQKHSWWIFTVRKG